MSVDAVAAVPAAPLLLPAASPAQPAHLAAEVADLRAEVSGVLAALGDEVTVALLAAGQQGVVHDRAVSDLTSLGVASPPVELPVDAELLVGVVARGGFPRGRTDRLEGDLAVLTHLCIDAGRSGPVLPLEIPHDASAATLDAVATGLVGAAAASGRAVAVVAAGDLSAGLGPTSPRHVIEGAAEWDERAVAALRAGDRDGLAALGPREARRVVARGWAPLLVALTAAEMSGLPSGHVRYRAPAGVGQVVLAP